MNFLAKSETERKLPPMLVQYLEYKDKYPDTLLFFQVGDFYETFFNDAVIAAEVLNITLTSRDKNSDEPIPMAGVPLAVIDTYIDRMVTAGHSVAIVSQVGVPRPGKMVKRQLERIVTPGIKILSSNDSGEVSITAAVLLESGSICSIAFSDVQSGIVGVREGCELESLFFELSKISPTEIILQNNFETKSIDRRLSWVKELEKLVDHKAIKFRSPVRESGVFTPKRFDNANGFLTLSPGGRKVVAFLVEFIDETTVAAEVKLSQVLAQSSTGTMSIDARTRDNLDLVKNVRHGGKNGSLFGYLDETNTPLGKRLLRSWIIAPSANLDEINKRLTAVEDFVKSREERKKLRTSFKHVPDIERIATRIELNVASPAELGSLRDGLISLKEKRTLLSEVSSSDNSPVESLANLISAPNELIEMLDRALVEDPPFALKEGGIFRSGYNSELDSFRNTKIKGKDWLLELELKEREKTGISSLKIKSNNIIGYFIEVTKANLKKVPESYLRKQQTTNSERFITEELKQLETSILTAESKLVELEQGLFRELREELKAHTKTLRSVAQAVAELDLYQTFAEIAERDNLIKPQLNSSIDLKIKAGRHPIIAKTLEHEFIPNDIELSLSNPLSLLVTGPNMGGKSTFLRQNALIVIMSQLGSFVPAASASLGLVDKVFARLGAADDLTEGESTFMVEMRETSFILANATEKSLILIDEIGRGTATRDGLAIARSVLEWVIEKIKCRSLFATHFHELTELDKTYASLENISVKSLEQGTKVVFTHEMVRGAANNSYGIEVADLAGLPRLLIKRSRKILKSIVSVSNTNEINQLEMFDSNHGAFESEEELPQTKEELLEIEQDLKNIDPSQMTPIEALLMLDKLQKKLIGS